MAFNRKPEKQILQQHRFEEFNQNSISKLISLRSTTHWHVLAESEQLQRESWNNTLSGPLAAGHTVWELGATGLLSPNAGPRREQRGGPPGVSPTAPWTVGHHCCLGRGGWFSEGQDCQRISMALGKEFAVNSRAIPVPKRRTKFKQFEQE